MTATDAQFENELEVFRTEVQAGAQFFYAYLAVNEVAKNHKGVYRLLNQAPLFWNTCQGALQTAAFVTLGRVFDPDPRSHSLHRLLCMAQENPGIFSREALGRRKQGENAEPSEWLDHYLRDVYEPTKKDFRRIQARVKEQREIYYKNYRDLRHKLFAHKEVAGREEVEALFAKTNIGELLRLFTFLDMLCEALWQLFMNGREPVLAPSPAGRRNPLQERITLEVEQFLRNCLAPLGEEPSR